MKTNYDRNCQLQIDPATYGANPFPSTILPGTTWKSGSVVGNLNYVGLPLQIANSYLGAIQGCNAIESL
jgi:hypothetical protein